ncbi:glycolate oxidase [Limnochorda pilosa]|uniref:Glycolate oxidase n=1 Tax=Limnochorda pilosa TaxID=1555112 RepID=A0A0K2SGH8_LIMPI|nr:glycolate oxidase [Limnochorda pilosa]
MTSPEIRPFFGQETLDQLNRCNKCGFCLPACPTYVHLGREPASPRGRLAMVEEVLEGHMEPGWAVGDQMDLCLGCRACESACPSGVQFGQVLEAARAAVAARGEWAPENSGLRRLLLEKLVTHPRRLALGASLLWLYQASGLRRLVRALGLLRLLPKHLGDLEPMLPRVPAPWARPPRARPAPGEPPLTPGALGPEGERPQAALFLGCLQDALFPSTNARIGQALQAMGVTVETPTGQGCCGALHAHAGRPEEARRLARANIEAFERSGARWIVNGAGGCGAMLKEYPHLLEEDPEWRPRAEAFSRRARDVSELLVELGARRVLRQGLQDGEAGGPQEAGRPPAEPSAEGDRSRGPGAASKRPLRVTYQDSCHLRHGQGVWREPRELLRSLPGVEYVELPGADRCCGSAGTYTFTRPEMSLLLLDEKMEAVRRTGADVVVTANPGCFMQMQLGVERAGLSDRVRVAHVADLVAETLGGKEASARTWTVPTRQACP